METFDLIIITGSLVTLAGFLVLIWCIVHVTKARRARLPEDELRAVLQKVVPVNFAALAISVLGLMLVVVGVALG